MRAVLLLACLAVNIVSQLLTVITTVQIFFFPFFVGVRILNLYRDVNMAVDTGGGNFILKAFLYLEGCHPF